MPTLAELRRAVADRVAPFELCHTGVIQGTGFSGVALDANRRRLVSSELASVDVLGTGPETPGDAFKNEWVYLIMDPPEQRRIPEGGFVGYARVDEVASGYDTALVPAETPVAYLDVERGFSGVVPAGLEVEIHAIPPLRAARSRGLHGHVNHAIRVILREDTVLVPGETGKTTIDVSSSFPWMTHPGCFIGVTAVETHPGVEQWAIPGARLRFDAEKVLLTPNTMVQTGQSLPVRVLRPLSSWIKPAGSGTWAESIVGLVDDGDQCLGDLDALSLVAAYHAASEQANASVVGSAEQTFWLAKAQQFAQRSPFLRDQRTRRPVGSGVPFPDFVSVDGPYGGRWGPGWR